MSFADDSIHKATQVGVPGSVFKKGAVGADAVAEGNVNVEVHGARAEEQGRAVESVLLAGEFLWEREKFRGLGNDGGK